MSCEPRSRTPISILNPTSISSTTSTTGYGPRDWASPWSSRGTPFLWALLSNSPCTESSRKPSPIRSSTPQPPRPTSSSHYRRPFVELKVSDNGTGPSHGSGGHGIAGMRERAALHGSLLEAGPVDGGGWSRDGHLAPGPDGVDVTIRILLVDDQALLRQGFRMILDQEAGYRGRGGSRRTARKRSPWPSGRTRTSS